MNFLRRSARFVRFQWEECLLVSLLTLEWCVSLAELLAEMAEQMDRQVWFQFLLTALALTAFLYWT